MADLLTPLSFAGLNLRNRIVMPPMWSGQATPEGCVTDTIVEYHRVRAAAGCALVIVEHAFVVSTGRHSSTQLGVHTDEMVPGLRRLAEAIRGQGAVACLQLAHAGSRGSAAVLGHKPHGPSPIRHPYEPAGEAPEPLTPTRIREVAQAFGRAAGRARDAGFDAVEIHAAHGFLLSSFLSPLTNRRTDDYGGAVENRSRIHVEVLQEVRRQLAGRTPVFVRLGAHDETPGGLELGDACSTAVRLAEHGAALIDVSGGLQGSRGTGRSTGYFVPYAEAIKSRVEVPVIVTGGIKEPREADRIIREGRADLVGIGRAMLEDPLWASKAIEALSGRR
ncbi:MAG: NADH:flavin oxidoreductase [Acidobacteria bacterium]|nr:NADH:flavin oxidoreductase [Acidobacteriota bacterium]